MSLFVVTSVVLFVLLFPIFVNVYLYADSDGGKVGFAVYLFGVAKVFGGYAAPYSGGIAFHVSKGTALLLPYKEILNARKKFEITKGFIVSGGGYFGRYDEVRGPRFRRRGRVVQFADRSDRGDKIIVGEVV